MEGFRVEPVYAMDAHSGAAHLVSAIGFIFSGVVDRSQIECAAKVVGRKWPILGARLRRSQELIALIPDAQHAILTTTFYTTSKGIHQIETLPSRTSVITTQRLFRNPVLYFEKSHPTIEELILSQSPIFQLHVSCLADATVFTFTFAHVLMGASGIKSVIHGLISVLEQKELLDELEGEPWVNLVNTTRPGAGLTLKGWTTYSPSDFVRLDETERISLERDGPLSQRTIYFPLTEVERLKCQAMAELKALELNVPFLSSGDVIVAWLYKHIYGDQHSDPEQTTRLVYTLDTQKRLPESFPFDKVYLRNSWILFATSKYKNREIRELTLGELARLVREFVTEISKRETILDHLQWKYNHVGEFQSPVPAGEHVIMASNWLMFDFGGLNISEVVKPGTGTGKILDVYWFTPNLYRYNAIITMRNQDGGINVAVDWAEAKWTSRSMEKYAIESTAPGSDRVNRTAQGE